MKRRQIKNAIIVLSIIGMTILICLILGLFKIYDFPSVYSRNTDKLNLIKSESLQLTEVNALTISSSYTDIILEESTTDELLIAEYSNQQLSEDQKFTITDSGNEISINTNPTRTTSISFLGFTNFQQQLKIYIPSSYSQNLTIKTSSGEIISNIDLTMNNITLSSSSGDIIMPNMEGEQLKLSATSGYIHIDSMIDRNQKPSSTNNNSTDKSVNITINTSSGDIQVAEIQGNANISATSGYIMIDSLQGDSTIKTSSGDIQAAEIQGNANVSATSGYIKIDSLQGDSTINTSSGDIMLDQAQGKLHLSSSSGYMSVYDLIGSGVFKTTSGDISLRFQEITGDILLMLPSIVIQLL